MDNNQKKVSFRIDTFIVEQLQHEAEKQYLSLSAYIRKLLVNGLNMEVNGNEQKVS